MFKKSEAPSLLSTTVMPSGSKFVIGTETKDTTFPSGTFGYLSYALGPDCKCPNVMFYTAVVIRRGQKGKWRVEQNMLLAPILRLPDVPLEFLVPPSDERKHFVDMHIDSISTYNLSNTESFKNDEEHNECMHSYLGYAFAKGLFLNELDSATKPIDHPLMKKLEVNGDLPRQRVFGKKKSYLRSLISDIEALVRDSRTDSINDLFWSPPAQERLFNELRDAEVALTLPAFEYTRKVNNVITGAIEYVMERLKSSEGKALPNYKQLLASAKLTAKEVAATDSRLSEQISRRLGHIVKNRELVTSEVPSPIGLPSIDGKVTHVFSSNQG